MKLQRKTVLLVNCIVFALVALLHLGRVVFGLDLTLGTYAVSSWVSFVAVVLLAYLAWNNYVHFVAHK